MVERSLEVHSSLSSSAAMDSPHACTTPARSGSTHLAGSAEAHRRGPARGGPDLRKLVDLSQTRAPSHADTAELRPCHPEKVAQTELAELHLCVQERCLKLLVVKHEVVRHLELLRRRWR